MIFFCENVFTAVVSKIPQKSVSVSPRLIFLIYRNQFFFFLSPYTNSFQVWCDWMMFHVEVWNPPPNCSDYKIRWVDRTLLLSIENQLIPYFLFSLNHRSAVSNHDPWNGLATLMTLLETIVDTNKDYLSLQRKKGGYIAWEPVRKSEYQCPLNW